MAHARPPLTEVYGALRRRHGRPARPATTAPFELVLWENVGYLVNDDRRAELFARLKQQVGCTPEELLAVPTPVLVELIRDGGMHPERRAAKLQTAAEIMLELGRTTLRDAIRDDPKAARRMLKRFPGFGDPGAEKVLLFNGAWIGLAPDSNALRVLVRLGYGAQANDYGKTYRSVAADVEPQLPDDPRWLRETHQLLRTHGQELCKNASPRCEACPLRGVCPSAAGFAPS